jgi:integrase
MTTTTKPLPAPARFSDDWLLRARREAVGERVIFEADGTGLGVRISPSNISFICQLRMKDGRRWRSKVGRYGSLTVEQARNAVKVLAGQIVLGIDPGEEARQKAEERRQREAEAEANRFTVRALVEQWHRRHLAAKRRSSYAVTAYRRILNHFADLLDVPAAMIDRKAVRKAVDTASDEAGPTAARNALVNLKSAYSWALTEELIDADPLGRRLKLPEKGADRTRCLDIGSARRVFDAADKLGYPGGTFVKLLLLTGARRSEISGLLWKEIVEDDDGWLISLPPDRTKTGSAHFVPLSAAALAVIDEARGHRVLGCEYVLSSDGAVHFADYARCKQALDAEVGEIEPWTFHDTRRSLVSWLAAQGYNPVTCDKLLGHQPVMLTAIARVYARHEAAGERREMLEVWGKALTMPPAEVVRMKRRRR